MREQRVYTIYIRPKFNVAKQQIIIIRSFRATGRRSLMGEQQQQQRAAKGQMAGASRRTPFPAHTHRRIRERSSKAHPQ